MKLIGIMLVRNEEWILGFSARVALRWCDGLAIIDHNSTDRTTGMVQDLAREFPGRISTLRVDEDSWDEMTARQKALQLARGMGATHLALIDGDEVLSANLLGTIRGIVQQLNPLAMLQPPIYNLRGSVSRYHLGGIWGNRTATLAFQDDPRLRWEGDQMHHREPFGCGAPVRPIPQGSGGIIHFWGASERRITARHSWYKVTERLRWPDRNVGDIDSYYNYAMKEEASIKTHGPWTFAELPSEWLGPYQDLMEKYFNLEMVPWQEAHVRELIEKHGRETFYGMDLFGI